RCSFAPSRRAKMSNGGASADRAKTRRSGAHLRGCQSDSADKARPDTATLTRHAENIPPESGRWRRTDATNERAGLLPVDALDETPAVEEIHLHDELGCEAHAREQWRHREIRLPAEPRTHRRDEVLDVTEHASLAPEVVEDHDCAARAYHAPHFAQHGDGI